MNREQKLVSPVVDLLCSYDICSAHSLGRSDWDETKNKAVFGKCAAIHGHQYKIELRLSGKISPDTGMLINGYVIDAIMNDFLEAECDHKYLNEAVPFFKDTLPTTEWIAVWLFNALKDRFPPHVALKKVRVYETPNLAAEYGC